MAVLTIITSILLSGLLAALIWFKITKNKYAKHMDKLPGPAPYPLLGNFNEMAVPREKVIKKITETYQKYGDIYRTWIGPVPVVQIAAPKYMEAILTSNVNIRKGISYNFIRPWLGQGLLTSQGQKWFHHRKLITPTFHFKILETFLEIFSENSSVLVSKMQDKADTATAFDVYPYITLCALDVICETAMGTKIQAQHNTHSPYIDAIYKISQLTMTRAFRAWLHPDIIFYNIAIGREYKKCLNVVHGFTEGIIKERKQTRKNRIKINTDDDIGAKKREAFLDLLLDACEADQGNSLSDLEIREEVDTFMFEGHDTTTAGMCWTLFLLGHHPDIQDKVFAELQDIFRNDPTRVPTMKDLNEMKLLERVIKESLRLYPSVPYISRMLQEDVRLGDHTLLSGTAVVLHIYLMHRSADIFSNPEQFDPDRFLPENIQGKHPFAYLPFSAGPRNCIGQKFALAEEKIILSTILRSYRIESVDKVEDITLLGELVLRPASGINVKIYKR